MLLGVSRAWDFNGVVPQDAPVVGVALWDNRAFLAVPRVWRDPRDRGAPAAVRGNARRRGATATATGSLTFIHDGPTLLEAPWPEPRGPRDMAVNMTSRASSWIAARSRRLAAVRAFPRIEEQVSRNYPRGNRNADL